MDFPEPLGPTSPAISFWLMVRFTFFRACSPPNVFVTSMQFSKGGCFSGIWDF